MVNGVVSGSARSVRHPAQRQGIDFRPEPKFMFQKEELPIAMLVLDSLSFLFRTMFATCRFVVQPWIWCTSCYILFSNSIGDVWPANPRLKREVILNSIS